MQARRFPIPGEHTDVIVHPQEPPVPNPPVHVPITSSAPTVTVETDHGPLELVITDRNAIIVRSPSMASLLKIQNTSYFVTVNWTFNGSEWTPHTEPTDLAELPRGRRARSITLSIMTAEIQKLDPAVFLRARASRLIRDRLDTDAKLSEAWSDVVAHTQQIAAADAELTRLRAQLAGQPGEDLAPTHMTHIDMILSYSDGRAHRTTMRRTHDGEWTYDHTGNNTIVTSRADSLAQHIAGLTS